MLKKKFKAKRRTRNERDGSQPIADSKPLESFALCTTRYADFLFESQNTDHIDGKKDQDNAYKGKNGNAIPLS